MELIFIAIAIIGTLYATITDIRNHWVPDFINFFMIFFGIGGHAIYSIISADIRPVLFSIVAALIFYGIALLMFHSGSWGGGDSKLLIGLGALLPTFPLQFTTGFTKVAPWPFILTLWLNIMLIGGVYTILLITINIAKNWEGFKKNTKNQISKYKALTLGITSSILIPATLTLFVRELIIIGVLWTLLIAAFYLTLITKALENTCMYKQLDPKKLVEGDWVAENIMVNNKTIFKPKRIGVEKKDIDQLIKLKEKGILTKVKVKEGFPYVPAFLIALIVTLAAGDILVWMFSILI